MIALVYNNKNLLILFGLAFFVFFLLLFKSLGLYPVVMADEYTYSKLSRLMDVGDSFIPGYLFLSVYRATDLCGDAFLSCARLFNVFFYVSSLPFIYMIARRVTGERTSLLLCALVLLSPVSSYTAYFMPESFYFLSFWVFAWFILSLDAASPLYSWVMASSLFVLTSFIKPHSFFFLPAVVCYIGYVFHVGDKFFSKYFIKVLAIFLGAVFFLKFGVGYLFAGKQGITIFGSFYGSMAESSGMDFDKVVNLIKLVLVSLGGHFLSISYIYAIPFIIAVYVVLVSLFRRDYAVRADKRSQYYGRLAFLSLFVILNLIFVVAIFTASIANTSIYETPYRLHLRYYNFALPMFYIVVAGFYSVSESLKSDIFRVFSGVVFLCIFIFAVYAQFNPYINSIIDNPEIGGILIRNKSGLFYFFSFFVFWCFIIFIFKSANLASRYYVYFVLPIFVASTLGGVTYQLRARMTPDMYDDAGYFTNSYLSSDSISKLLLVGSEPGALFRTLYHLDTPVPEGMMLRFLDKGAYFDLKTVPEDKDWVLVVGDHKISGSDYKTIIMNGFTLIRIREDIRIDFSSGDFSFFLDSVRGLSSVEPWGRWSDSASIELIFSDPLPDDFDVIFKANAYGPNFNSEFKMVVGDEEVPFSIVENGQVIKLSFKNKNKVNLLKVVIPFPTSPKELGKSSDDRKLGIGLIEMMISPNN